MHVHVHATTGVTLVSLMKAIEAGADCVDTAISSMSLGPGHNPTESLVEMLEGTGFATQARQGAAAPHQGALRDRPAALHRVPLEHHRRRDRDLRLADPGRHDLEHGEPAASSRARPTGSRRCWPRCRTCGSDAGFPPLVTPSSQIVGTQAVFNVMMGRYKVMTGEFADLMLGYYGRTDRAARPGGHRAWRPSTRRRSRSRAGRPICSSRSGTSCAPQALALDGLQRHRRGRPDLRDVPAGGAQVLRQPRTRGRRTSAKPKEAPAPAPTAPTAPASDRADDGQGPGAIADHLRRQARRQDAQGDGHAGMTRLRLEAYGSD